MIIEKFKKTHVENAAQLLVENYNDELKNVPALPRNNYYDEFCTLIAGMAETNHGVVALHEGEIVGFILGMCLDSFKGLHRAIYCPIHAHGAKGDKIEIYQRMYENIADTWVKNGCLTHSLTIFAHDKITIDTWFHIGFGNMCIDAIRTLNDIAGVKYSTVEIRPATQNDAELLLPIITEHKKYYASSPIFMPVLKLTKLSDIDITNSQDSLTVIALDAGKPVGIMDISKDDTTFVDYDEKTLHFKRAYIKEEFRGTGLGAALLQFAIEWLRSKGYERCNVDYESANRLGSRFWGKHFTPFAYSMFRKLDERITWAGVNRLNDIMI
jgi:GNAT superfamily N-acetyltransferase